MMQVYKHIPIIVEAEQFFPDKKPWPDGVYDRRGGSLISSTDPYAVQFGSGRISVHPNDWVVRDKNGNYGVMRDGHFKRDYELVGPKGEVEK